jgi:hypothetical protein
MRHGVREDSVRSRVAFLAAFFLCATTACSPGGNAGPDAGPPATESDAGDAGAGDTTTCGEATCTATQVCEVSYPVVITDGGMQGPYYDGCVDAPASCFSGASDAGCSCFGTANPCPGGAACLFFESPHVLVCD